MTTQSDDRQHIGDNFTVGIADGKVGLQGSGLLEAAQVDELIVALRRIHESEINPTRELAQVTVTLPVRLLTVGTEADLPS